MVSSYDFFSQRKRWRNPVSIIHAQAEATSPEHNYITQHQRTCQPKFKNFLAREKWRRKLTRFKTRVRMMNLHRGRHMAHGFHVAPTVERHTAINFIPNLLSNCTKNGLM